MKHGLPGTSKWAELAGKHSGGALWNNGTYAMRDIRGGNTISNHARGVAMDLSYRFMESKGLGVSDGRIKAVKWLQQALDNWQVLGIQCVLDYWPKEYGRGWRCDRVGAGVPKPHAAEAWVKYSKKTITGAPDGDWLHIEITRDLAENPGLVEQAFRKAFPTIA
jgi:hypothetical protein